MTSVVALQSDKEPKGSITVEASIVVPIVILSIMALIFIGFLLYQRSLLQVAADTAVEKGAAVWSRHAADMSTGEITSAELKDQGLYWRIYDTDKDSALKKIENYETDLADKRTLLHSKDSAVEAYIRDYVIYKRLEVTVENSYHIPLGSFLKIFGAKDCFTIKVTAYSIIDDPTELIRNTDFIIDIEKELEDKNPGLKNLGDKTRGIFGDIKGKMSDFLN